MQKVLTLLCLTAVLVLCVKKEETKAIEVENEQRSLYDLSQEIFVKVNEMREEHGKISHIHWDSVLYYIAEKSMNQLETNPESFGKHITLEESFQEQHFIQSFGEVIAEVYSQELNPEAIVDSWKYSKKSLETLMKDYELGAVCVKTVNEKSYAVGIFAKVMVGNQGPRGDKGDKGFQGIPGPQGIQGENCNCSEAEIVLNDNLIKQLKLKLQQQNYKTLPDGSFAASCAQYQEQLGPYYEDGIYMIKVNGRKMKVSCEDGWIVFLRRTHDTNFYQDWQTYAKGFGDLEDDFWLGLQNLHELTKEKRTLEIDLWHDDQQANSVYSGFQITNGQSGYAILFDQFESGEAGTSLDYHKGQKFSTYDHDNDQHKQNCALYYECGWWFNGCHEINLTGRYSDTTDFGMGINCNSWLGQKVSLTKAIMKLK